MSYHLDGKYSYSNALYKECQPPGKEGNKESPEHYNTSPSNRPGVNSGIGIGIASNSNSNSGIGIGIEMPGIGIGIGMDFLRVELKTELNIKKNFFNVLKLKHTSRYHRSYSVRAVPCLGANPEGCDRVGGLVPKQ